MVTSRAVTLHVGQLKTATTSLQSGLFAARNALVVSGYDYRPAAGRYHLREALDLMRRDPESASRMSRRLQHTTRVILAEHNCYWPDLVNSVKRHSGRTLLSAESLSFAAHPTAARVARDLDGVPIRIVATTRPLSGMVVSAYGELAKRFVMPDADAFVRGVLLRLLEEGDESRFSWLLARRLRSVWAPIATEGWFEVPFGDQSAAEYQRAFWRAMGIESIDPPGMPEENSSLPAGALIAWQEHLRRAGTYDARVDGGTVMALMAVNAERQAAPRSRLRLTVSVAALVDRCFPHSVAADEPADHAVAMLRDRLRTPAALVEYEPIGVPVELDQEVAHWRAVLVRKHRVVGARIAVARFLRVRRSAHPDWDRFRGETPLESIEFPDPVDG